MSGSDIDIFQCVGFLLHLHSDNALATAALLTNLRSLHSKQGGSTLTQQLAKVLFTTRKKTYTRKIFELFCAKKIETKFTKDQILLMYLNFAYFGHGCYGVESASRYYFNKPAKALELAEAARGARGYRPDAVAPSIAEVVAALVG